MADKDIIEEAKEAFKQAEEAESHNRETALDDICFARLSEQWPTDIQRDREQESRPCLTINRMPAFIRQVVNDGRLNKPSIKVHPVDDNADVQTAEVLNGLIRNIEVQSKADVAYDTSLESAVTGGFGYFRINVDYASDDSFDQDIKIERIANPFTVYGDPSSTEADSADWNKAFVTEMLTDDEFESQWKDAEKVDWEAEYNDRKDELWFQDKSVRVAEYWTREEVTKKLLKLSDGQVMYEDEYTKNKDLFDALGLTVEADRPTASHNVKQTILTAAEVLEENEWPGRFIPIVPVYGDEINVEGKRYFRSLIHDAKDPQRMFNYWRTASTELVALSPKAPWIGATGAFDTDPRWDTANTKSHSTLEYDPQSDAPPPHRQPFDGPPAGALQEALNASDDMKSVMGIYDASLGARSNETSGKAIMARQREGDISTFHFQDNMSRAIRHAGLILVDLIPKVYNTPRMIRILGEDETAETVPVNQPFEQETDPQGQPVPDTGRIFDLTTGKYDVTVKSGPSFTSRREEAATQMMELLRVFPQAAPIIGDIFAKNLDWPGADEIAERLKALVPNGQGEEENPQIQQMTQHIQALMAELQAVKEDNANEFKKLWLDFQELQVKGYEAETKRMEAEVKQATVPPQVQFAPQQY